MTIRISQGRSSGTLEVTRVPYIIVEDDTTLDLDIDTARQLVLDRAYTDSNSQPASVNSTFRDLGPWAHEFEVVYSPSTLGTIRLPVPGESEFGLNYQAEGETMLYSPHTLDWAPEFAPNFNGLVGLDSPGWGQMPAHRGIEITPRMTHWGRLTVNNEYLSPQYMKSIGGLEGTLNSKQYWIFEPGCARLVALKTTQRDNESFSIYVGFDYRPPVPTFRLGGDVLGVTPLGPIDVPYHDGWDVWWAYKEPLTQIVDGFKIPTLVARFAFVESGRHYFGQADWESVIGFQPQIYEAAA